MDGGECDVCPVCTLYLRPGMTLKDHLPSHPKQKVIDALIRLSTADAVGRSTSSNKSGKSNFESSVNQELSSSSSATSQSPVTLNNSLNTTVANISPTNISNANFPNNSFPGVNHSIIYQQFMSSSGPQQNVMNLNPLNPQYVTVPTVFNPQMMCSPYVYQQQQVIMSSGPPPLIPKPLAIEIPSVQQSEVITIQTATDTPPVIISNLSPSKESTKEEELHNNNIKHELVMEEKEINEICILPTDKNDDDDDDDDDEEEDDDQEIASVIENDNEDLSKACQTAPTSSNEQIISDYVEFNDDNEVPEVEEDNGLNFIEMDGMKLVLANDFLTNPVVSQVEEYECVDRSRTLMTIGGMNIETKIDQEEILMHESLSRESLSRESANIRSDERMPARGELSGQEESNECSDNLVWCKLQYNESSHDWEPLESCSDIAETTTQTQNSREASTPKLPEITTINVTTSNVIEKSSIKSLEIETVSKKRRRLKKEDVTVDDEKNFDNLFRNNVKLENDAQTSETKLNTVLCTICNELFPTLKNLKDHKIQTHKDTNFKYKCKTCNLEFNSDLHYATHLEIHPLECKLCGKLFHRRKGMELHLKRHLGIKPFKCDICTKSFITRQKREEHRNIHTGASPIKCNLCDETFRRYSNLIQHRNRHHLNIKRKMKDFLCHCGEVFHSKKKLAWHKEIHDIKPKSCTYCSEKFLHMSSLTRHMRHAHNENFLPGGDHGKENVECPICKGIYLKSSLDMHIRNHSGQRPFKCPICNKAFTTKWNLKLHKWTHAARTSKPFKCDQCNGAFIRESDYIAHMNSHKSFRPYTCNHCGAQFIRKSNCQRHVKEHETNKTYVCNVCSKKFHRSYYLKDHMRVHSGDRPYSCNICGKTSATKSNHNKHVRIHHAREPVGTEN